MPLTTILLVRHGHRLPWTLDPTTGQYSSNHPYPTSLPADPPLASHGVTQSREVAAYFVPLLAPAAKKGTLRIYSSLYYRCLQTLEPTVDRLRREISGVGGDLKVRGERGFSEWFGHSWFNQPVPASPTLLQQKFFPWLDASYESLVTPSRHGEYIVELHERVARAFEAVISDVDAEYEVAGMGEEEGTLVVCGHAAQIIAAGRVLTGDMPEDLDEEDYRCFTAGISRFVRRRGEASSGSAKGNKAESVEGETTGGDWRGRGVAGGWDCELNSYCGHLSDGEERGWHFHGDESFDSYAAGAARGPIVEDGGVPDQDVSLFRDGSKL